MPFTFLDNYDDVPVDILAAYKRLLGVDDE